MTGSQVKRLSRDMRANGYNPDFPVTAAEVDGRLILMDGHHRTDAAIRAGLSEIPVRVVPVTPAQAVQLGQDAAEAAALRASRRGW
jgi:ParB-like nuclease domain